MKQGLIKGFKMGKGRFFHIEEVKKSLSGYRYSNVLERKGLIEKREFNAGTKPEPVYQFNTGLVFDLPLFKLSDSIRK